MLVVAQQPGGQQVQSPFLPLLSVLVVALVLSQLAAQSGQPVGQFTALLVGKGLVIWFTKLAWAVVVAVVVVVVAEQDLPSFLVAAVLSQQLCAMAVWRPTPNTSSSRMKQCFMSRENLLMHSESPSYRLICRSVQRSL